MKAKRIRLQIGLTQLASGTIGPVKSICGKGVFVARVTALLLASAWRLHAQTPCYDDQVLFSGQNVLGLSVATNGVVYYADYFGASFGFLDFDNNRLNPLVSGLNHPASVEAAGNRIYFTESGSDAGQYHDGTLSVFDLQTTARTVIATGLQYPVSLFIDAGGNVYVLEAAGSSTSFGGYNRLLKFGE